MATRKKKVRTSGGAPFARISVQCSRCKEWGLADPSRVKRDGRDFRCPTCRHRQAGAVGA